MWYFAWILGLPLAVAFAVLNAMWFELMEDKYAGPADDGAPSDPSKQKLQEAGA
ncbi:cytochrome bd-I oxidase subunit CydX [Pseudogemmobacter sonorensis]|uniref:cytochrome bd-I oxidase subunit CydX n=1 Tax=Pseudogemmobacter sonorensis TaxID=2989681 RepID=UPI00368719FD